MLCRPEPKNRELELPQEAQVVRVEITDIVDVVPEHGDALDAKAGSEASVTVGVVAGVLDDLPVDHPGAADLEEALVGAGATAGAVAYAALDRDLGPRLDEGEVVAAKSHAAVTA